MPPLTNAVAVPLFPPKQDTLLELEMLTATALDCCTVVLEVDVQLLVVLVTVKVYKPGALTVGVSVFAPETTIGPAH